MIRGRGVINVSEIDMFKENNAERKFRTLIVYE